MSFQTGQSGVAPPGPDVSGIARLRAWFAYLATNPNPVWVREMKQSARLTRTPFILMTVTLLTTLVIATIGGVMSTSSSPGPIGTAIYHTFFSLAFFVVTLAGPVVAANSIASEREGRTWEALQLTGLPPPVIARGKFLAAFTSISLYIVMMAPVGAMAFLFGGITATETLAAFVWLFVLAGLSVAFGLAISSKMESLRGAIVLTFVLAIVLLPNLYFATGVGGSMLAHELWPLVSQGHPVWLPMAYARAPFDVVYVTLLWLVPAMLVAVPAWFLYEVTVANLTSISDDRSTGLRRWFLVSTALLAAGLAVAMASTRVMSASDRLALGSMIGLGFCLYLASCVFVFLGEPIGPSRRVQLAWQQRGAGALRRAMGPGLMQASWALLVGGLLGIVVVTLGGLLALVGTSGTDAGALLLMNGYGGCFFLFLLGLGAWLRARTGTPGLSRILLLVTLFLASVGPWVLAAMAGVLGRSGSAKDLLLAAPSPFFALVAASELRRASSDVEPLIVCAICAFAWALLGLGLLLAASMRSARIIRQHEKALAEGDAFLAAEDAAQKADPPPAA